MVGMKKSIKSLLLSALLGATCIGSITAVSYTHLAKGLLLAIRAYLRTMTAEFIYMRSIGKAEANLLR